MAIKVSEAATSPALVYNGFFLEELKLTQRMDEDDTAPPYYVLDIRFRMFAVDSDNVRHFEQKVDTVRIEDYAKVAYIKALAGDLDLANAAAAIELALASIIIDQKPELGSAEVL